MRSEYRKLLYILIMKIPEQKTIFLIAWRKFLVAVLLPRHFLFYDLSFHLPVQFVSSTLFQQLVQLSVPFWLSTIILIKCFDLYPLLKINPTVRKLTNVFEFTRRPQNLEPFFHVPEYILDFQKAGTPFQYSALRHTSRKYLWFRLLRKLLPKQ